MRTQGIVGAVLMAVGGMCPLVRVPIMGNWNYFDLDQTLAITFYVLVVVGLIGAFTAKAGLVKFVGLGLVLYWLPSPLRAYILKLMIHSAFYILKRR